MCPVHNVHSKFYGCTLVVNEENEIVLSVQCQDCITSEGGCEHAIAFLMWVHRRSEEPPCTSMECYWEKSKLSIVSSTLKYITAKDLGKNDSTMLSNPSVLNMFLEEGKKRKIRNCELLKYQPSYCESKTYAVSMHQLTCKFQEKCVDAFLEQVLITEDLIKKIEETTRDQSNSSLSIELKYGRITPCTAFAVSRCNTNDDTLISLILGGEIPKTSSMKRGQILKDEVRKTVEHILKRKINKCGLMLNSKYPMIAGCPDGIFDDGLLEIQCPISAKIYENYIKNGEAKKKYNAQMQLQMYLTGKKNCFFCVADPDYEQNRKVEILSVPFNIDFVENIINDKLLNFWKTNVYPLLYQGVKL